jgi:4-amino-4-deoxy-L-arabinose transferase
MNELMSGIFLLVGFAGLAYMAWRFLRIQAYQKSLFVLLLLALVIRVIGAKDPYLHSWDERYHALVAKNLIDHPLEPTLHSNKVLDYNNNSWVGNNVWVAKPSFPLWLMAGSIATFGNNLIAVRLPSILLGLLAVWLTFLIGRRLFDERVGLMAAFFHAINGLVVELIGGRVSSDHVEVCFIVMVELAIYFLVINLKEKPSLKNTFFAGAFMGLAFLSKWYPALIVAPVWLVFFITYTKFNWVDLIKDGLILLLGFAIVTLPWTMYMIATYPDEMNAILFNALSAYSSIVESHDAPFYYYFHKIMVIYGELVYLVLGFFIYSAFKTKALHKYWGLLVWILVPLLIFSMADTKRFTYILIGAPAFFIATAWFWFYVREAYLNARLKWLSGTLLVALLVLPTIYMVDRVKLFGGNELVMDFYKIPAAELDQLSDKTIVFGTDDYVEMMFHTDVYAAYRLIPSKLKMQALDEAGYAVLLLQNGHFIDYDSSD